MILACVYFDFIGLWFWWDRNQCGSWPMLLIIFLFACFVLYVYFDLELIAFVLLPSAHGRGEVRPGVCFFCCFRVLHVVLNLPGEAHATCSPRLRWGELWRGKFYPSQGKRFNLTNSPVTGGVMSPGKKSWDEGPHFVVTREHSKHTFAHHTHSRFLSCLFHEQHEDNSTGGQQRWRRDTTGYRMNINTGRHVEFRATMDRRFDYHHHRSFESDTADDQRPPRDPENVP